MLGADWPTKSAPKNNIDNTDKTNKTEPTRRIEVPDAIYIQVNKIAIKLNLNAERKNRITSITLNYQEMRINPLANIYGKSRQCLIRFHVSPLNLIALNLIMSLSN